MEDAARRVGGHHERVGQQQHVPHLGKVQERSRKGLGQVAEGLAEGVAFASKPPKEYFVNLKEPTAQCSP